ncbi:MAG: fumarylacetoacetate hydrolase family protein [Wenzhouxiangella sp.]
MSDRLPQWQPPTAGVAGGGAYPVRHVWCVGRNYAEHAREMGANPDSDPIFFSKPAQAVVNLPRLTWPARTQDLHHEVELVVFLADGGRDVPASEWLDKVFGYAVGVDLTRRDVQASLKKAGHPWEVAKGFDHSAPVGAIVTADRWQPAADHAIELQVNGMVRQQASLGQMIWSVPELLEQLSRQLTLNAGDVIFTGTPAGVAGLQPDDRVLARIHGLPTLEFALQSV